MEYIKRIVIIASDALYVGVRIRGIQDKEGWSIDDSGIRTLTLPATRNEYEAYWRNFDYAWRERPMRSTVTTSRHISPMERCIKEITTRTFVPNRHQRKHRCMWIDR